jgi:cardiolipin synthase
VRLLVGRRGEVHRAARRHRGRRATSIDLEYYIFLADSHRHCVRDALIERARAGVHVRCWSTRWVEQDAARFFAPLVEAGGEFAWFHRCAAGGSGEAVAQPAHASQDRGDRRAHRYTGGINVTDEEDERLRADAYRDVHVRWKAMSARRCRWCSSRTGRTPRARAVLPPAPEPTGDVSGAGGELGPGFDWEAIHRCTCGHPFRAAPRVADHAVFRAGEAAMMALTSAALGGLDVRLLVPRRSDSVVVTYAARSYFDDLLAAGVRVYEYGPRLLHSKTLLSTTTWRSSAARTSTTAASASTSRCPCCSTTRGVAREVERLIELDLAHAPRVRDDRRRPLWRCGCRRRWRVWCRRCC